MLFKHSSCFLMVLVLILFAVSCGSPTLTTTVEVTGGAIEGLEQDGIFTYKGIPFAAPPVGELRWKTPEPVEPWTDVKKADAFGPACMQAANSMGNTAPVS
jgi:para-nitrobenzyl esterase